MKRRGQVWIESVIYTLIGLAIIGLVLAIVMPKINQKRDETHVQNSIGSLEDIGDMVYGVQGSIGNRRKVEVEVTKGKMLIDMDADKISWVIPVSYKYSEENLNISRGEIDIITTKADPWQVEISMSYLVDLQYEGQIEGVKEFSVAPQPYVFLLENVGIGALGELTVAINEEGSY